MVLEISPFQEHELRQFALLTVAAFQTGLGHLLTGPNNHSPENIDRRYAKTLKNFREDPAARYFKVTDSTSGEIVAAAQWLLYPVGNTEAQLDEMFQHPTADQEYPTDWEPLFAYLNGNRREIMGTRAYLFLNILVTHPDHHRRGAGNLLLKSALDEADGIGIECYLESSIEGRPLY